MCFGAKSASHYYRVLATVFLCMAVMFAFGISASAIDKPTAATGPPILSASEIDYPPFCFVDASGNPDGFSVELMRSVLAAMGRGVTFRTGPWSEVKGWLEQGKVQALPLVGRTPEREAIFDFTFPYMTLHGAIVVRVDSVDIEGLQDLKRRQVAVMKGDNAEEFLRREDREIEIHTTTSFEDALRELSQGRYDAVIVQRLVALRLIQEMGLKNLRVVNKPVEGFRQDFCFAVKEGDRDTLALLNEGLALVMADGTYNHLHAKWFAALELPARRIVVGGDHNYPPYEYLDERGRPTGFNVDLTRAIAREAGLDIEIRLGPWTKIVEGLEKGEIDVIEGMFYSPDRDLKFDFSSPYLVNHCVGVVRKGEGAPPSSVEDLKGKRIVVQKGDIMYDFAFKNGVGNQISFVDSQEDALQDLAEGRYDCALVSRLTALYCIKKSGWKDLVVGERPILSPGYCYAVPKGHKALLASLSEGLKVLDGNGEYRKIYDKWVGIYKQEPPSLVQALRYSAMVLVPLLLLLLGSFLWSRSLRKQVAHSTAQLRESEEFLRAMFTCSPVALYSIDLEGNVLAWNTSAKRIFGWKEEEVIGKPLPIVPKDKQEEFAEFRRTVITGKTIPSVEVVRTRKDGSSFHALLSAAPVYDASGRMISIMSAMEDITERKRWEAALRESEDKFKHIFEHSPIGKSITYPSGEFQANAAFYRMLGYSEAEGASLRWQEITHSADIEASQRVVDSILNGEMDTARLTKRYLHKEGSVVWAEVSTALRRDEKGRPQYFMTAVNDITERKRGQEELQESEERYRTLIDAAGVARLGVVLVQDRGSIEAACVFSNAETERLTGYPKHILEKTSWFDLLAPGDREAARNRYRRRLTGEELSIAIEVSLVSKDGEEIPVQVYATLTQVENKAAVVVFFRDIRDRKVAEAERERLRNQLIQAQKLESVGRLAGGVAHDFNNMLGVIIGYADLALVKVDRSDPIHADLKEILAAAKRSAEITGQLLAFARKQTIAPRVLDLNETVESVLKMLRRLIGEDIDLAWLPYSNLWPVKMDSAQIDQILANLCVNARDAIAGMGKVTIETGNVMFDQAYCAEHAGFLPGGYVLLAVSDDGCGMDKETLNHIFEPFFTTKGMEQGTGLGLATVFGIVKQNNGFINVYSEPDKGTTFRIYLPRHMGETEQMEVESAEEFRLSRGETVLLVEDDLMMMKIAQMMLERLGYQVLAANKPSEAMRLSEEHAGGIHLLITDVVMPELNGRDLAHQLRTLYPDLKVLFMSGYTANTIAHRGVLDESVNFIQKPFTTRDLAAKVRVVLDS